MYIQHSLYGGKAKGGKAKLHFDKSRNLRKIMHHVAGITFVYF